MPCRHFVTPLPLVLLMVPAVILAGHCRRLLAGQDGRAGEPGAGAPGGLRGRGNTDILAETYGLLAVASRGG